MIYYLIFTNMLMFAVVLILLRQANRDREERMAQMNRYENLAMQVRLAHLQAETHESYMNNNPYPGVSDPLVSVADVEGS